MKNPFYNDYYNLHGSKILANYYVHEILIGTLYYKDKNIFITLTCVLNCKFIV